MGTFKAGRSRETFNGTGDADTFVFARGTSGTKSSTADTITKWSPADSVDMPVAGSISNYEEGRISFTNVEDVVECINDKGKATFVFAYNPKVDTGWLLTDLNNDDKYESCIVLKGSGSYNDFSYLDII